MLSSLLLGSGFAFAAAIQPGPLQAYLFSSVAQRGWRRTLPAALAPLLGDGPIILTVILVLTRLPDTTTRILETSGGIMLLYFAWSGYLKWRRGPALESDAQPPAPRTLLEAAIVDFLNPNAWLAWSLVMGPALIAAWQASLAAAAALLLSFYGIMVGMTALIILLLGTTGFLNPSVRHSLVLVSAIILALLAIYRLATGLLPSL